MPKILLQWPMKASLLAAGPSTKLMPVRVSVEVAVVLVVVVTTVVVLVANSEATPRTLVQALVPTPVCCSTAGCTAHDRHESSAHPAECRPLHHWTPSHTVIASSRLDASAPQ